MRFKLQHCFYCLTCSALFSYIIFDTWRILHHLQNRKFRRNITVTSQLVQSIIPKTTPLPVFVVNSTTSPLSTSPIAVTTIFQRNHVPSKSNTSELIKEISLFISNSKGRKTWWRQLGIFFKEYDDVEKKSNGVEVNFNYIPLPKCNRSDLRGELSVDISNGPKPSFEEIANANPNLSPGGKFRPNYCQPEGDRVAIVIPYRNREFHLRGLLSHLHPILQRQELNYQVFVVEQVGNDIFNKALLMNAAYKESQRISRGELPFTCYIFHDVDLLPQDDRGIYNCNSKKPLHLSEYIDKFGYFPVRTYNDILFGGVVSISRHFFELVNGYSNLFFGWGGEDDDMGLRLLNKGICYGTVDKLNYRYKMFKHLRDDSNNISHDRFNLMSRSAKLVAADGINSASYQLEDVKAYPTHTSLLVSFNEKDVILSVLKKLEELSEN